MANVLETIDIGKAVGNNGEQLRIVAIRHDDNPPGCESTVSFGVYSPDASIGFYVEDEVWQFLTRPMLQKTQTDERGRVFVGEHYGMALPDSQVMKFSAGEIGYLAGDNSAASSLLASSRYTGPEVEATKEATEKNVALPGDDWDEAVKRAHALAEYDRPAAAPAEAARLHPDDVAAIVAALRPDSV